MAKINLKNGLQGRLIGSVAGGAASAVFDRYVVPMLGESLAGKENYAKIGLGVVLPMVIKGNQLITSISDSLMAIGVDKLVGGMLTKENTDSENETPGAQGLGSRFQGYKEYIEKKEGIGTKVGSKVGAPVHVG